MKTSTRLTLWLTMTVSGVMALLGYAALRQRAAALEAAALDEARAHAITLRLALEEDYATGRQRDARRLLERLHENTGIYGVILFDEQGVPMMVSERLAQAQIADTAEARSVIVSGREMPIRRRIEQTAVLSYILPLQFDAQRRGALEVSLPVSFVEEALAQERRDILIFLAATGFTILLVVGVVLNRSLVQPVNELVKGVAALGEGALHHRVAIPRDNQEFGMLARAFNGMAQNLTAQQQAAALAAEERLQLERRLRHSERLAAVGQLAAGVAHDIGAPLQVISGRTKQLRDQPDAPAVKRERNLDIIRAQTDRITRIIRNLLDFSRPFNPTLRPVDLHAVVTTVLEACELPAAEVGVTLEHRAVSESVLVIADTNLLQQVFLNLCQNALHAMPNGGTLRIDYALAATVKDGTPFTLARVSDTGSGIAPENLTRIFDPFFTTKAVGQGTGLGLAMCSRILEEHGGWIDAANQQAEGEQGAQFSVYLPQAQTTAAGKQTVATPAIAAAND